MSGIVVAPIVAALAFLSGLFGFELQRRLPARHTSDRSRDMISAVNSLVTLVLALVLGTLISSGYAIYSEQKTDLDTLAANALQLDMTLAQYGPETIPARVMLKEAMTRGYTAFWSDSQAKDDAIGIAAALPGLRALNNYVAALNSTTPAQERLAASAYANVKAITVTRLMMSEQLSGAVAWPLLYIIAAWSLALFCGYGLLSQANAMTAAALATGAIAIGAALFLIIELRQPYRGWIHVPATGLEQAIAAMGG